ncbi:MAG TPA: hypothetical protein PKC80_07305 [Burkholderiaceae bacterium]|nr:hypothetical protein [Burkholderiaceae bacterium]
MTKSPIKASYIFSVFAIILIAAEAVNTPARGLFVVNSQAQTMRNFPLSALRGNIIFKAPPEIVIDGKSERLSPGARIKDAQNLLVLTAALAGKEFVVNYKRENIGGMVSEVWILTAEEAKIERKNPAQ